MKKPGRHRSSKNIPAHINAEKLPVGLKSGKPVDDKSIEIL